MQHNPGVTTVLVVDDEPIVREVVVRYLEREGSGRSRRPTATGRANCSSATLRASSSST
jgi:CheY-like chemotaxis protein